MAMNKTVFVLGSRDYSLIFVKQGWNAVTFYQQPYRHLHKKINLICFTGGRDVNTELYKELRHPNTEFPLYERDIAEIKVFNEAKDLDIPMVGICRGAQLGCVLSGGKLIQDINNHNQYHSITLHDGREMVVSSDHHQMMFPQGTNHKMLAWSTELSSCYHGIDKDNKQYDHKLPLIGFNNTKRKFVQEPEVVFFPDTKFLAHQPHPEWMDSSTPYQKWFFETIHEFLKV